MQQKKKLRSYQLRLIEESQGGSSLIVLPTGAGKTLIAAEIIKRQGLPAVFLVPTVLLVEQQQKSIAEWTGFSVMPFRGGKALPSSFDILVSTPSAFLVAQKLACNTHIQWRALKVVVFDEAHHVLKKHPYRTIALALRSSGCNPYVAGLTASYTYAFRDSEIQKQFKSMCDEMRLTKVLWSDEAELRASGYHALGATTEKPESLLQDEIRTPDGVVPINDRKPHQMQLIFTTRVHARCATPLALAVSDTVSEMEKEMQSKTFIPPFAGGKAVKEWAVLAHKQANSEEKKGNMQLADKFKQLEQWYESLRLLVVTWEEASYAPFYLLSMTHCFDKDRLRLWSSGVQSLVNKFRIACPNKFPRLEDLKRTLLNKHDAAFRGVLFVNQRITTHILEHFIRSDTQLSRLFSTACIYAFSTPATPSFRATKSQCMERLSMFREGKVNLLISTVVAEEGMDIPAANCVIRFDPMEHVVSLVQGRGRARADDSSLVILSERADRTLEALEAVEKRQHEFLTDKDAEWGNSEVEMKRPKPDSCDDDFAYGDLFYL